MRESPSRPTRAPGGRGPGSSANLNGLRSSSNLNGLPWLWLRWVVLLLVGGDPLASSPPPATNQHGYCNCPGLGILWGGGGEGRVTTK